MHIIFYYIFNMKKFFNLKLLIISSFLTILFTIFSVHWYVDANYWANKYPLPEIAYFQLQAKTNQSYDKNHININEISELKIIQNISKIGSFYSCSADNINHNLNIGLYLSLSKQEQTYNLKILSNSNNTIKLTFHKLIPSKKNVNCKSIKVNNKELINQLKQKDYITIDSRKGKIIDIDIIANYEISPISFFKSINFIALLFTIFLYLIVFYTILVKIKNLGLCNFIKKTLEAICKNKIPICIFCFFFVFYSVINLYSATHIDFFDDFWILCGDCNTNLENIMNSTTKRFHPYHFLPIYPLFDFLFFTTKDFLISVFLLYTTVMSVTISFLFKVLQNIDKEKLFLNLCLVAVFGFCWSCILFNYSFEMYIFTSFYLSVIIYLIVKTLNTQKDSKYICILIGVFSAFSFGVNLPNIIAISFLAIPFIIKKKYKELFFILLTFVICTAICVIFKDLTCRDSIINMFYKDSFADLKIWVNTDIRENLNRFYHNSYLGPIAVNNENLSLFFISLWEISVILSLLVTFFSPYIKSEEKYLFISLIIALGYNYLTTLFWASGAGLLFSQNFLILIFISFGYSIKFVNIYLTNKNIKLKHDKYIYIFILVFIILLLQNNYYQNKLLQEKTLKEHPLTINLIEKD